jgi:hypothetical protein
VAVVAAPVGPAQTRAAIGELEDSRAFAAVAAGGVWVLVDGGRVDLTAPPDADVLALLVDPTPVELARLTGSVPMLTGSGRRVGLLLAGVPAWPVDQVAEAVGLPVFGVLPDDPRTAAALAHSTGSRAGRRGPLLTAATDAAETITDLLRRDRPDDTRRPRLTRRDPPSIPTGRRPASTDAPGQMQADAPRRSSSPVGGGRVGVPRPAVTPVERETGRGGWVPTLSSDRPDGYAPAEAGRTGGVGW